VGFFFNVLILFILWSYNRKKTHLQNIVKETLYSALVIYVYTQTVASVS
jgi:hypothetical protein